MTLPSFLAAAMSCGVIAVGGGAAAKTLAGDASAPTAKAVEPLRTARREMSGLFIVVVSLQLRERLLAAPVHPLSTRQRSGGRWTHTDAPCGIFSAADATTRNGVPSAISTISS